MTARQISNSLEALHDGLIELSRKRISLSNYNEIMREYQVLLRDLIDRTKELAEVVDVALIPRSVKSPESKIGD